MMRPFDHPIYLERQQKIRCHLRALQQPQPLSAQQLDEQPLDDPHWSSREDDLPELLPPILSPRDEVYQALSVWWRHEQSRRELLRGQALWSREEWDHYHARDASLRAMQASTVYELSSAARAYLRVHPLLHLSGVVIWVGADGSVQAAPCVDLL